jgi:hypothetical protein
VQEPAREKSTGAHFLVPTICRSRVLSRDMTWLRCSVLAAFLVALAACPNPNTYTSARTLRAGDAQVLVAAEGYAGMSRNVETDKLETDVLPSLPTIGVRYGLADSTEIGLRAVNLMSLAADTKVQLRRGDLDLALDPGLQWFGASGDISSGGSSEPFAMHVFDLHVPLLLGFNINQSASLVVSPGVTFRTAISDGVATQWFGVAGVGLNVRVTPHFAIQPQVTMMWTPDEADSGAAVAGLGMTFGGQPRFNELVQPTEPAVASR